MSDPAEIYLQPECCADEGTGRLWCDVDAPVDCEDGVPWTKYVLAERYEALRAALQSIIREPEDTMSNGKALAAILRTAKAALAGEKP